MRSIHITTNVVRSNPAHGEVYAIQHYVIKMASDLRGQWFSLSPPDSSTNKSDRHDITEILLKMVLNTITLTLFIKSPFKSLFQYDHYVIMLNPPKSSPLHLVVQSQFEIILKQAIMNLSYIYI